MTDKQRESENYLLQIRNASKELMEMIDKIEYLRYKASGATGIRYDKDHVQTSPEDMMCQALAEAADLERKLSDRHKRLIEMRDYVKDVVFLWNDKEARAIEIYYLNHGSMVDVARQIHCTDRNAYLVRQRALDRFYNML